MMNDELYRLYEEERAAYDAYVLAEHGGGGGGSRETWLEKRKLLRAAGGSPARLRDLLTRKTRDARAENRRRRRAL